jgi:hypothetical protein
MEYDEMRKYVLALIAGGLLAPMMAGATPVQYDLTYDAVSGPSGVGSFVFDVDNGAMSNFNWNFDGAVGGLADSIFTFNPFHDTLGRFIFEMLSHVDVHSGADCTQGGCGFSTAVVGEAPFGASGFELSNSASGATYEFQQDTPILASGSVTLAPTSIPEPATLGLFGLGMLGLSSIRRRAKSKAQS